MCITNFIGIVSSPNIESDMPALLSTLFDPTISIDNINDACIDAFKTIKVKD